MSNKVYSLDTYRAIKDDYGLKGSMKYIVIGDQEGLDTHNKNIEQIQKDKLEQEEYLKNKCECDLYETCEKCKIQKPEEETLVY